MQLKSCFVLIAAALVFWTGAARALEVTAFHGDKNGADITLSGELTIYGVHYSSDAFGGGVVLPADYSTDGREFADIRITGKKFYGKMLAAFKTGAAPSSPAAAPQVRILETRPAQKNARLSLVDISFDNELTITFALLRVKRKTGTGETSSLRLYTPEGLLVENKDFYNIIRESALAALGEKPKEKVKTKRGRGKKHEAN